MTAPRSQKVSASSPPDTPHTGPSPPPKRRSRWRFLLVALALIAAAWAFIAFNQRRQSLTLPGPVTLTFSHVSHGSPRSVPTRSEWYPSDKCFEFPSVDPVPPWAKTYNKWRNKLPKMLRDVVPRKNEIAHSSFISRSPSVLIFRFQGRFIDLETTPGSSGGTMHEPWQISFVDDAGLDSPVDVQTWDDSPAGPADYESGWIMIESFPRRSEWLHLRVRPTHNRVELATSPVAAEMRFRNPARDLSPALPPPTPAEAVAKFGGTTLELVRVSRSKTTLLKKEHRMECEFHVHINSTDNPGLEFDTIWIGDDFGNLSRDCFGFSGGGRIRDGKFMVSRWWNASIWSDVPAWKLRLEVSRGPWHPELYTPAELFSFQGIPAPTDMPQSLKQSVQIGRRIMHLKTVRKKSNGAGELEIMMETPSSVGVTRLIFVDARDDQGRIKGAPPDTDRLLKDEISTNVKHAKGTMFYTWLLRLNLPPDAKTFDVSFAMEDKQVVNFRVPVTTVE